jgi:hypothetical protein
MERSQQYISTLLERVPRWELTNEEHQFSFDRIKQQISGTANLREELSLLFQVQRFSEFALGLLWIAEKADRDPSKVDSTIDEESFVLTLLKKAMGEESGPAETRPEQPFGFDATQSVASEPPQTVSPSEPAANWPSSPPSESFGEPTSPSGVLDASPGSEMEQRFSLHFEKLLESIQSGTDDRSQRLEQLVQEAEQVNAGGSDDGEFKTFCALLIEFLNYISSNQLYDDIRVMNLVSNVYDPLSQWAKMDPAGRPGMLAQPIEMLHDFRTLIE